MSFLPAARLEEGLVPGLTIAEHVALQDARPGFRLHLEAASKEAAGRIEKFRIKGAPQTPVEALSGGNQQRLLLSFLPRDATLLLMENPSRGLDVESTHWAWQYLLGFCRGRTTIVFSSPELDEIMAVANRVLVFFNGRIFKDVATAATDLRELGRAIAGKD